MTPPAGYAHRDGGVILRPRSPTHAQLVAAPAAVLELRNTSAFRKSFGTSAGNATNLADALHVAYEWSVTVKNSKAYLAYAREQEQKAWAHAWPFLDVLRPIFVAALAANNTVRATFQGVAQFYGARTAVATKGVAKRAKTRSDKAAKAASDASVAEAARASGGNAPTRPTVITAPANDNTHPAGGSAPNTPAVHAA